MIDDLDRSIEAMLRGELPQVVAKQVAVTFAPPDSTFPPPDLTLPAVDLFLYDLRENLDLRRPDPLVERRKDRATAQQPPMRLDCAYLVTAWASDTSASRAHDEHRILGEVALLLARSGTFPDQYLRGRLADQPKPLPVQRLQDPRLGGVAEYWQALGGKPKPGLSYVVTLTLAGPALEDLGGPVVKRTETELRVFEESGSAERPWPPDDV
jgi:hypothetical protein